ncbi:MAG: FRG domain-containing protein [Eubacteriales bacterium]|nr:FRG domain-containing protein [Eubacteriales bacterium]
MKKRLEDFNEKVSDSLDFDFSAVSKEINTVDEFNNEIYYKFLSGEKLFYRGERISSQTRHLLPTMLRNPQILFENNDLGIVHINADYIYNFYSSLGSFVDVFHNTMGAADSEHLYDICAFAQHYCHFSPLIDFTKSIYPSLSFALKDRKIFDDDIVLYVLELKNDEDYTTDINTANKWLSELNVYASYFDEDSIRTAVKEIIETKKVLPADEFKIHLDQMSVRPDPKAKLIDVPTNTRMRFQQGVFLLLNDFQLFNVSYFTRNIRNQFIINKYIISKDICPYLANLIEKEAPWYAYKYLTDVESAFKIAIKTDD